MTKRTGQGTYFHSIVEHGDTLYLSGIVADDFTASMDVQTKQVLDKMRTDGVGPTLEAVRAAGIEPIGIIEDAGAFHVELPDLAVVATLGELCPACGPIDGMTVPKPPFTAQLGQEVPLSETIVSARVEGGSITFEVSHDLGFDPLRPGGAERGAMVVELRSGGVLLARDSIEGASTAMPPGSVLSRTLALRPANVAGALNIGVTLYSPAGSPVDIDLEDRVSVTVPTSRITVSDLRLLLDEDIATEPLVLELDAIDSAVRDRVRSARVHLEIENPFDLTGDLDLRIASPNIGILKPVPVAPGRSEQRVDLSRDEIFSILSESEVVITLEGPATTPAAGTPVEPEQELSVRVRLELVVASST